MRQILVTLLSMVALNFSAFADNNRVPIDGKFPIDDGIRVPIRKCIPVNDRIAQNDFQSLLREANQSFNCGQLIEASNALEEAIYLMDDLTARNSTGRCYSKKNCARPLVSSQKVTKKQCEATEMDGASWQATNPKLGKCINL